MLVTLLKTIAKYGRYTLIDSVLDIIDTVLLEVNSPIREQLGLITATLGKKIKGTSNKKEKKEYLSILKKIDLEKAQEYDSK